MISSLMIKHFKFFDEIVLRTPAFSIEDHQLKNNHVFREALYLASPSVFEKAQSKSMEKPIRKYENRSKYRCTPFGLFAGCSVIKWGETSNVTFEDKGKFERRTYIDIFVFKNIVQYFIQKYDMLNLCLLFTNSSLYKIGNAYRYVEINDTEKGRSFKLAELDSFEILDHITEMCKQGQLKSQIIDFLISSDFAKSDSEGFIHQLIENQVLVTELDINVTGENFFDRFIEALGSFEELLDNSDYRADLDWLKDIKSHLLELDKSNHDFLNLYEKIINSLLTRDISLYDRKIFHVEKYEIPKTGMLNRKLQGELLEVVDLLKVFAITDLVSHLKKFKEDFWQRYEDQKVPLTDALDAEHGIGYANLGNKIFSDLLENIDLKTRNAFELKLSGLEIYLLNKIIESTSSGQSIINLGPKELKNLDQIAKIVPEYQSYSWDDTMCLMFKHLGFDKSGERIQFSIARGSSAVNLISRFACSFQPISDLAKKIVQHEDKLEDDGVIAEIINLPEHKVGNVIRRPLLRPYEIPYLGVSGLSKENQIPIDDIMVSVVNNKIVLTSKKHDKIIVPRLSTAHNFIGSTLPIYRFLCDLQSDHKMEEVAFNWGKLNGLLKKFPRVQYKNIILAPACWNFNKEDYATYLVNDTEKIKQFFKKWGLPEKIAITEWDNELQLDISDERDRLVLIDLARKKDSLQIIENLYNGDNRYLVTDRQEKRYTNECVAFIKRTVKQDSALHSLPNVQKVRDNFIIGSEWIYYKLYCGEMTADIILRDYISELVKRLNEKKLIKKWFFVRFFDTHSHLRVRFQVADSKSPDKVINECYSIFKLLINEKKCWKVLTDTYTREMDRYGHDFIEYSENIFHQDSSIILKFLQESSATDNERWLFAVLIVDRFLNDFELSTEEKKEISLLWKESFYEEYKIEHVNKKTIDQKYREYRGIILEMLGSNGQFNESAFMEILDEKTQNTKSSISVIKSLKDKNVELYYDIISSNIHMSLNRLFHTRPRAHELIIYDFLYRSYNSLMKIR